MISCILFRYKYRRACGEKHLFFPAGCFIRSHLQKMSSHIKTNLNLISFSSFNSGEAFSYPLERHIVSAINIDIAKTIVDMLLGFKMISIKPFTFHHPLYPVFASQILSESCLSMASLAFKISQLLRMIRSEISSSCFKVSTVDAIIFFLSSLNAVIASFYV